MYFQTNKHDFWGARTPIVHVDGTFYFIIYGREEFITIAWIYPAPTSWLGWILFHWVFFASNMNLKARHGFFPGVILHQKDLGG